MNAESLSYYLALRHLPFPGLEWQPGYGPAYPEDQDARQEAVGTVDEIATALKRMVETAIESRPTGILLSGGIDSAILAAYLPPGVKAYTIDFAAVSGTKESDRAARYAESRQLDWQIVPVTWTDYAQLEPTLFRSKRAPLHAVEVALHKAARQAQADGIECLLVGNGADSTFGGLDKLLSRDWAYADFVKRYTFVDPASVLKQPADVTPAFAPYRQGDQIDFIHFLKKVHGNGIIQAFQNSVAETGITLVEPFECLKLKGALDLERIRRGEPKYLLFELFAHLYPQLEAPAKVPFARPMDEWLADYAGPVNREFLDDLRLADYTGDQKYLIYCLDRFLSQLKEEQPCL